MRTKSYEYNQRVRVFTKGRRFLSTGRVYHFDAHRREVYVELDSSGCGIAYPTNQVRAIAGQNENQCRS